MRATGATVTLLPFMTTKRKRVGVTSGLLGWAPRVRRRCPAHFWNVLLWKDLTLATGFPRGVPIRNSGKTPK